MIPAILAIVFIGLIASRKKMENEVTSNQVAESLNPSLWNGWVWPVPITEDRYPVVSQEYKPGVHLGVDIMFRKNANDPKGNHPPRDVDGFIIPVGTVVIAAGPGKIWDAGETNRGHHIQLDHGIVPGIGGVNTFYQHLASFEKDWRKGDEIKAGDVLGEMGGDPDSKHDPRHTVHLHFETWFPVKGTTNWTRDPAHYLSMWRKIKEGENV